MNWVDYIILSIIIISIGTGCSRGFIREVLSLLILISAYIVVINSYNDIIPFLKQWIVIELIRRIIAIIILLLLTLLLGKLITWLIKILMNKIGMNGIDRTLGILFGGLRGILLVILVITLMNMTSFTKEQWWRSSYLIPYFKDIIEWGKN